MKMKQQQCEAIYLYMQIIGLYIDFLYFYFRYIFVSIFDELFDVN